jgi:hypothetical protein
VAVDGLSPPSNEGDLPSNDEGDLPSNKFSFGKLKRNKKKGTAKLTVTVPGPGGLQLNKRKKLRAAQKNAPEAGKVKLPIKPRPKGKKRLNKHGNTTVTAKVTFTPEGGEPKTKLKRLKLKKRS